MAAPWILESKLTAPAPPPSWLARGLLPGGPLPPATLLLAGPGYGKTLGLLSLARRDAEAVTLWYALDEFDADPATFFHYLVAGMRMHIPQFGSEVLALLTGDAVEPRRLWQAFFQAAAAFNLPGMRLVLDDAHAIADGEAAVLAGLFYFLDKLPPRTHVLLASRQRLPFPTARLEARGALAVLNQQLLRFSVEEEEAVIARLAPEGERAGWSRHAAEMDGWPLGVCRLAAPAGSHAAERDDALLSAYVASEIVEAQPPGRREWLLRLALLPELTPEASAAVFDEPRSAALLAELEADQLIVKLGTGARYRFPSYLWGFLKAEAARAFAAEALGTWHRRAAAFFLAECAPELALPHMLAAADWEGAIACCQAVFPAMRFSGRQGQIARWLSAFPEAVREASPPLLMWRGHLESLHGRLIEAQALYVRARRSFEQHDHSAGVFKATVRLATLALLQQEAKEANRLLLQATAHEGDRAPEDVADLALARALAADLRGDVALMRECNEAVLQLPIGDNVELAASHWNAHMNLHTLRLLQGELRRAEHHVAQARALADAWSLYGYWLNAAFLQAHLKLTEGEVAAAEALVAEVPPVWEELLDWHGRACAHVVVGQLHQAKQAWREAEEAFRRAMGTFEAAGFQEGRKVPLERLMHLALQRRQPTRTEALLAEAGPVGDASVYDMALWVPHGRSLHLQGRHAEAEALLARAAEGLRQQGARLHLAQALLPLAAARLALGEEAAARAALEEADRLIGEHDYGFLRRQDQVLWEELARLAPTEAPDAQAEGGLALRCLGGFEARLDGVVVDHWPRKKARILLAALALHPKGLTLGQIMDLLGETAVTAASINAWQVVISALRRTLEPTLPKRGSSRYVLSLEDRYVIDWAHVAFFDVKAFREAAERGDRLRDHDPTGAAAAYEEALALYTGPLLEGLAGGPGLEAEREQLQAAALAACDWLAAHHQARAEEAEAERHLRRAIELAPTEEATHLQLMRYAERWGKPELIRQAYWDCRKLLKARLGLEPSEAFEAAYRTTG